MNHFDQSSLDSSELDRILQEVRSIELVSSRLVTDVLSGGYSSVFRGSGVEFSEVREYVEGDDPRSVDWNVTARLGKPYIKKFVDERELSILFVVDLSSSMEGGFGPWSGRQVAARLCACLGISAFRNNDKVGLLAFSNGVESYLEPTKGMAQVLRIVRDILAAPKPWKKTETKSVLEFINRVPRKHTVVFFISDFLGFQDGKELSMCGLRHDVVAIRLILPEMEGLDGGLTRLSDPEDGSSSLVDWNSSKFRDAFRSQVEQEKKRLKQMTLKSGVDLVDVLVPRFVDPEALIRPLVRFFRMRESRGAKR